MCNTNIQSKALDWVQVTPLLVKADNVLITKQKISNTGEITTDEFQWALSKIDWQFKPVNKSSSIMEIAQLPKEPMEKLNILELTTEKFDFLSGAFKFYFDTYNKKLYGEVEANELGFNVTYRYWFDFYGSQTINAKDFLIDQSYTTCYQSSSNINNVTAL